MVLLTVDNFVILCAFFEAHIFMCIWIEEAFFRMRKHRSLWLIALVAVLCATIIVGSTYAYYTDEMPTDENMITSGDLEVAFMYLDENGAWKNAENTTLFAHTAWEPNYAAMRYVKVQNTGDMAFQYELNVVPTLVPEDGVNLMDVIDVYFGVVENPGSITRANFKTQLTKAGTMTELLTNAHGAGYGLLLPVNGSGTLPENTTAHTGEVTACIVLHMQETAGNEYMGANAGDGFKLQLVATQYTWENDAFGNLFASDATLPDVEYATSKTIAVTPDQNGCVPYDIVFESDTGVKAVVPKGAKMEAGARQLILIVYPKAKSDANLSLKANEVVTAWEVKVEGLADDNTVPVRFALPEAMQKGLNIGNYALYHVENGLSVPMTRVEEITAESAHNSFTYNPATGDMGLAIATFSEVAIVSNEENAWNGEFDYTWYTNAVMPLDGETVAEYTIANADQLAAFGAIVGGMAKDKNGTVIAQDSFAGKTVKLIADINLGDKESENKSNIIFYPIGYNSSDSKYEKTGVAVTTGFYTFEGTFDGNGHTISSFYQNTWEMKGDNNYYDATLQYYRDGMGLFGKVYGGTVKNLTVSNFSSDGEYTTTGVIAAYADGATFENIAVTNCNPRVYNIGNGGIVGCVGWYAEEANLKTTFTNITVDNSNKISALWGSYDVACGGIVGQYYPTSGQTSAGEPKNAGIDFVNCHVSAQMDVYNDVCGNYQYYAYRYAGMMIGSIRENTTNDDGKTIPDMTGISATGCTVNYGDWNDYYYCEFEKNGHPSYSGPDDYKFSRVPHSELNFTDSNGNGLVDADERTSVTGCKHDHTDAENNKAIYLPFHQLFTGYGWGVNSIGLEKYSGIVTNLDITEGDQEESVEKFEGKVTELSNNTEYKLGDIFCFVNNGVELVPGALTVSINNLTENNPVSIEFIRGKFNWEDGTVKFTGVGNIQLIIQDYYFCTPTTIIVNIKDKEATEKFETKFTGDFLYRVGNQNAVKLDSLFQTKADVTIGDNVSVMIEAVNGTNASGTYTPNATWTNGTIQFSGTGVVKVTITDNDYCKPTELYLEVVDATNLTSATGTTTGGNFVLLCDVNTTSYVNYWNCTLYGNGFTYSLNGAPTAYNSKQGKGVIITKNSTLDNLVIVGDVYTAYGAYTNQDYYNTAIDVTGDMIIQNCYISGCAAPVRARNNVTIKDTTLYGGAVGNLIVESGTVTLENVTTANFDDGRKVVGMGIVIHPDATESAKLVLNGTLTQYNFISESKVPTDTYAKNIHTSMFGSSCSKYHFGTSPNRYVNTGIVSLMALFNAEDITDNANTGYAGTAVTESGVNGYVYSQPNTSGSVNNGYDKENDPHVATTQGAVPPSYSFDYTDKNYVAKTDGSNDYCYEENGKVNISMDEGDTFNWDTSILTIGKGITNYTVSMNGTDYTGKSIAFDTAGDYEVKYTYTDPNNFKLDENGNITTYSKTYTKTVNITVAVVEAATKHAEFAFGSSNTASTTVTIGNNTYVMPNVSATSSTIGSTTVDGQTIYYPIVEIVMSDGSTSHYSGWYAYFPVFSGAVTITDYADNGTGDKMTPYNGSTTTMPSGLSVVGDAKTLFKYQSGSNAGETPVVKNNILVYSSAKIEAKRSEYNTVVPYSYTDNAGATYYYYIGYHAPKQSYTSCVTPDTLVTLADGSKKEIQNVNYEDQLLVWDFYKGEYAAVPASIISNHGYANNKVIALTFSDGTEVKAVNMHTFMDATLNKMVLIDDTNVQDYVGHSFVKANGDGYTSVELVEYKVTEEYIEAWGVLTAVHYNAMVEDMFSIAGSAEEMKAISYFEIGEGMKYDEQQMQADIEKYGLYSYEEFADCLTEEQFEALGVKYMKVSVCKGLITRDYIMELINTYIK